jgi:hypothetical protein
LQFGKHILENQMQQLLKELKLLLIITINLEFRLVAQAGGLMSLLISLASGILCALFGWSGGRGDDYSKKHGYPAWMFKSWTRDWLIAPLCALTAVLLGVHSWIVIFSIPLIGAALSTYWEPLFKRHNFWFHGFMVGVACFPIALVTGHWWMFVARSLLLALWMGGWSALISDADGEEAGRYFIMGSTLWMIC